MAALAVVACGGGEDEEPAAAPQQAGEHPAAEGRGSEPDAGAPPDAPAIEDAEDPPEAPPAERSEPGGCAFTAPPGRLARGEVAIELDGVACDDAVPLARAAALGQPAGANLTIDSRGYECEPSTTAKGANVTYTCTGRKGSATFDVVWTEPAG